MNQSNNSCKELIVVASEKDLEVFKDKLSPTNVYEEIGLGATPRYTENMQTEFKGTLSCWFYFTVNSLVSGHTWELKKVSVTGELISRY